MLTRPAKPCCAVPAVQLLGHLQALGMPVKSCGEETTPLRRALTAGLFPHAAKRQVDGACANAVPHLHRQRGPCVRQSQQKGVEWGLGGGGVRSRVRNVAVRLPGCHSTCIAVSARGPHEGLPHAVLPAWLQQVLPPAPSIPLSISTVLRGGCEEATALALPLPPILSTGASLSQPPVRGWSRSGQRLLPTALLSALLKARQLLQISLTLHSIQKAIDK